jgi:hypothetical protein
MDDVILSHGSRDWSVVLWREPSGIINGSVTLLGGWNKRSTVYAHGATQRDALQALLVALEHFRSGVAAVQPHHQLMASGRLACAFIINRMGTYQGPTKETGDDRSA